MWLKKRLNKNHLQFSASCVFFVSKGELSDFYFSYMPQTNFSTFSRCKLRWFLLHSVRSWVGVVGGHNSSYSC